ncbi:MAG: sigma-54-dependent Fis family transcriptional regulator [Myxococcaceae bacterium]|nr:sigma-54-dependent Fis family transcriptional regulator [Myxococcaceae bacterium]
MLSTLLVDDDRAFSAVAAATLSREGFPVQVVHSLHDARLAVAAKGFDLVVLDRRLPDGDGLAWLPELKAAQPGAQVVLVTAHGDIASAVDAMRLGAADYLAKPIELSDLLMKSRRAADDIRLRERLQHAEGALSTRRALIHPVSAAMQPLLATLERLAKTSPRSPVVLLGETGVGKEALAWHLHQLSFGEPAPFIQVNCAALPESMAESELFGHEKGSFTDAKGTRRGLVELAHGGTLFLDEVGELSAALQAKLLTFLDSGRFRRLGGATELTSVTRVVAATNRDLEARVKSGEFREDLWFRLSVFRLQVPPLRERQEDLPSLAHGLLARIAQEQGRREVHTLSAAALTRLARYRFPGNVRELRNILERAAVLETSPSLELDWLAPAPSPSSTGFVIDDTLTLDELERRYARWVLTRLGDRRMDTAKALGISHPTLAKLLRED